MTTIEKLDAIMQSGLQFRFFNRPVQDDYLWDIKCFWTHEDCCTSEGFDSCEECIDNCYDYLRNYDSKPFDENNQ